MPRPDPWRLSPDAYPHRETIQTRFQDLDVLGHINNVAWAALFESARVRFLGHMLGSAPGRARGLVANVEINYLGEGHFPADVLMAHGVGRLGTRSWQVLGLALQNDVPLATCDVTVVAGGAAMEPEFRAMLERWMLVQP
ncbi:MULTISPECIES: acyl-CoA thioesterase [Sphingomonas]|uniref:acyl-CoA thioesterase n=1 Tax=Sphingomonas TaxID=13687 RepID=UPI00082E13DE|nr:acyl-CoA thioesterase [Sphingomonas sp. CCH10-B3]